MYNIKNPTKQRIYLKSSSILFLLFHPVFSFSLSHTQRERPGLDFINVLRTASKRVDLKIVKKNNKIVNLFYAFRIYEHNILRKTLVKLTSVCVAISQWLVFFVNKDFYFFQLLFQELKLLLLFLLLIPSLLTKGFITSLFAGSNAYEPLKYFKSKH